MARFSKNKNASIGKSPGELIFIGDKKLNNPTLNIIDYDASNIIEKNIDSIKESLQYKDNDSVTWLNIYGIDDIKIIEEVGQVFKIHPLTLEDILNTGHRPKMEEYDNYLICILKMMSIDDSSGKIKSEQLSIIIGDKFVITFQETAGDIFEPVRNRMRKNKGRIRHLGSDYLAYALLDTVVDNYLSIIGHLGEQIEELETHLVSNPTKEMPKNIYYFKQELNYLRKSIRPTKDFIIQLRKVDDEFIKEETSPFLKDLLDLTTQVVETIDVYGVMLTDFLNIYDSMINSKLNEIIKVLTIFSVFFIPMTFIAGIYGTNFEYIPEFEYRYSYFIFWGVLISTGVGMLTFFKRKKWI